MHLGTHLGLDLGVAVGAVLGNAVEHGGDQMADLAEFDPAELLAPYTGDIAAEGISKALRGGAKFLRHGIQRQQRYVAEAITEEWRMAPGPLEVAWFAEETAAVERAVDALTRRLEKLEAK